jgi:hypothetical protein
MEDKRPLFKMSKLKANKPTLITFTDLVPKATGSSKYGDWELYALMVKDCPVVDSSGSVDDCYTGECGIFISTKNDKGFMPKTSKKILDALKGGVDSIKITKTPVENEKTGTFYTEYQITDMEGNVY